MARTENQIFIARPRELVFDVTNDFSKWTEIFTEYKEVKVLEKSNNKYLFQLTTHAQEGQAGMSWISSRIIDRDNWRISAKRENPVYPWTYMNIEWLYEDVDGGTKLTFLQEFGVDPRTGHSDDDGVIFINKNSAIELQHIKETFESGKFD